VCVMVTCVEDELRKNVHDVERRQLVSHDYKHTHRPSSHPLPVATQLSQKGLEIKVQLNKYIKICLLLDKNFSGRHVICSQQCARQQQSSWTVVDIDR